MYVIINKVGGEWETRVLSLGSLVREGSVVTDFK